MKIIRNDSFTEFVWSCYAYANWFFFLLPTGDGLHRPFFGNPMQYSGDYPFWRLAYLAQPYQRMKLENDWGCSFQRLFLMDLDEELDWVTLDDFNFMTFLCAFYKCLNGGIGSKFVSAINNRDYTMIMATTIFLATLMVVANVICDLLYKVVDPRIKYE